MEERRAPAVRRLTRDEESNACRFVLPPESLEFLRRIARERLPLILTDDRDVEGVSTLVHAGQLEATMQVVLPPLGGGPQTGVVVSRITRLGWTALAAPDSASTRVA